MNIKLYVPEYKKEEFKKYCEKLNIAGKIYFETMFFYIENNALVHADYEFFILNKNKEITIDEFLKLETLDEPINRTHEEIMDRNNWFYHNHKWSQVEEYLNSRFCDKKEYCFQYGWYPKEFFNALEMSKGIPPEGNNEN